MKFIFLFLSLILFSTTALAEDITVQAEGIGVTKMEALNNAWSEAVRNAVGLYLNSRDVTVDNKVTEQIATYSRGRVNAYKILKEEKTNNGWKLLISANIDKDVLQEAKTSSQKITVSSNQIANLVTDQKEKHDAKTLIETFKPFEDISSLLKYQSRTMIASNGKLLCIHLLSFNDNYKKIFAPQMEKFLSELAIKKKKGNIREQSVQNLKLVEHFVNNFSTLNLTDQEENKTEKEIFYVTTKKSDTARYTGFSVNYNTNNKIFKASNKLDTYVNQYGEDDTLLFLDNYHYIQFTMPNKEIINALEKKFLQKKYEISFSTKIKINTEEESFDTSFYDIEFFHSHKNKAKNLSRLFHYQLNGYKWEYGPILLFVQEINLPSEKLSKIESIECSYELQEK